MNRHFAGRTAPIRQPVGAPADAPIASWLHIGPNSAATITVSFPGTYKSFALTSRQARQLKRALIRGCDLVARDDGNLDRRIAIDLMKGNSDE